MRPFTYKTAWSDLTVESLVDKLLEDLYHAPLVDTGHWQAKKNVPQVQSRELLNVTVLIPIRTSSGSWASYMRPNLPWAEDHFQERVSGKPLNPPPSHVDWPFNQRGNEDHMDGEVFSHSYPERLWPMFAPIASGPNVGGYGEDPREYATPQHGIRYRYGDLDDLVSLLSREPFTRQAYVPLWFPEDLAATVEGQRVPCTLGYHFILRDAKLHCFYPMRSLDVLRYFQDDAYMAGRLCQWVIGQCRARLMDYDNNVWHEVTPGTLTMAVVSCHIFQGDLPIIEHRLNRKVLP